MNLFFAGAVSRCRASELIPQVGNVDSGGGMGGRTLPYIVTEKPHQGSVNKVLYCTVHLAQLQYCRLARFL